MTEELFDTYVSVLEFMIRNNHALHSQSDIRKAVYGDVKKIDENFNRNKTEIKRIVEFFTASYIFTKVDEEIVGSTTLKLQYPKYRLFNKEDVGEVEFNIPTKDIGNFTHTVVLMLNAPNSVITDEVIQTVLSNTFGLEIDFMNSVVSKILIKMTEYSDENGLIPLNVLIQLSKLKSKINISMIDDESEINLNKTNISKITINENSLDLKFKNTTVTLTDINQIKSIQSYDTPPSEKEIDKQLREDIKKLKTILTEYPTEVTKPITELIDGLSDAEEMFVF